MNGIDQIEKKAKRQEINDGGCFTYVVKAYSVKLVCFGFGGRAVWCGVVDTHTFDLNYSTYRPKNYKNMN